MGGRLRGGQVLPGTLVALLRRRTFGPRTATRIGAADAALHAVGLGAAPVAAAAGALDVRLLPVLLGLSSLLSVYGTAARYTVVAAVLPERDRLAGNAAMSALAQTGVLVGPAVAALVLAVSGPVAAVAVDAASFALLAVAYRLAAPHPRADPEGSPHVGDGQPAAGVRVPRVVPGVLVLTAAFYGLYGPVGARDDHPRRARHGAPADQSRVSRAGSPK